MIEFESEFESHFCIYLPVQLFMLLPRPRDQRCVNVLSTLATETHGRYGVHSRTEAEVDEVLGPERAAVFKPHYRVKVPRAPLTSLQDGTAACLGSWHSSA